MGLLPLRVQHRLGLALFASAMLHGWLLGAFPLVPRSQVRPALTASIVPGETAPDRHVASGPVAAAVPFIARLAQLPDPASAPEGLAMARTADKRPGARPVIANLEAQPRGTLLDKVTALPQRGTAALAQPVDTTWYAAHDLDTYPRALGPITLEQARVEGQGARLLLWLRIDEFGQVVEVKAGESGAPDNLVEAARASLTGVRFAPARKDERAVRSRVLLSVSLAGE